jgi:hypothetical protein
MRNILLAGASAFMMIGIANAQTTTTKPANPNMQTPPTEMHKDQAAKQNSEKAGAMPKTNVSGATSSKGKGTMPENPNAKKGTVNGTTGASGSGPNASGSNDTSK